MNTPVSLAEVKAHLNLDDVDSVPDDELWRTALAATAMVEAVSGVLRPRQETVRVRGGGKRLNLPVWPVLTVDAVVDDSGAEFDPADWWVSGRSRIEPFYGAVRCRWLDVTVTVGRNPVPDDLVTAVLLQTGLLWGSQRGPASVGRWTAMQGSGVASPGGLDRKRLDDILSLHRLPLLA